MKNQKTFKLKNGITASFAIVAKDNNQKEFFVVATSEDKQIGFCHFIFEGSDCKISRIAITDKNYLSKGVGTVMFNAMECLAHKTNKRYITGLFIPRGYDNAWEMTSKFYKQHNMKSLDYDFDYVDRDEIYKIVEFKGEEYVLPIIANKKLFEKIEEYNYQTNDMFSSNHNKAENKKVPDLQI